MKANIHPTYYPNARVICSCGATWTTGSTLPEIRTDVCSTCHPFYTGEQRIVDTAGQVERFMKKMESAAASGARPSKRQQRLAARSAEMDAQKRRETPEEKAAEAETEVAVEVVAEE